LPATAALLLFPRSAADSVLWARAVPVAGSARARDRRHRRRIASGHAAVGRLCAVRAGRSQASAERAGRDAEQSGVERFLSVEERRGRGRECRALPAHHGLVNTRLICHLPLLVPAQCTFRVGNELRDWQKGKAWLFDDTIEHEAWNRSDQTRVILLFDVWRPELAQEERDLVVSLFEAIDAHGGGRKPDWEI